MPAHHLSPVALEAVTRIDAIFDVEREINGPGAVARIGARQRLVLPAVGELHEWMRVERGTRSRHDLASRAIAYMIEANRWGAFTRFLDDGWTCLTSNAAEWALRVVALGGKSWLIVGSQLGGDRASFLYRQVVMDEMNDIDPLGWRADILARLPDRTPHRVPTLRPWTLKPLEVRKAA